VALLGAAAHQSYVAELAGIKEEAAEQAVDALVAAGILAPRHPLDFVHPVVRQSIYADMTAVKRSRGHRRAARVLVSAGASPALIGSQLLVAEPTADQWVCRTLRALASDAISAGAADI